MTCTDQNRDSLSRLSGKSRLAYNHPSVLRFVLLDLINTLFVVIVEDFK
jgi:hypothetical protein